MMNLPPFGAPFPVDAAITSTIIVVGAPALRTVLFAGVVVVAVIVGAAWRARGRRSASRSARAAVASVAGARG